MIIFDEKRHAEEILKKGFKTKNKTVFETFILAKYFFYIGLDETKVKQRIIKFYEKFQEDFNLDEYYKVINRTINYAINSKLKTDKKVHITQYELDIIQSLNNLREQKLAFVMLVLYKFNNFNKFTVSLEDLFKLSELATINSKTRLQLLHKLTSNGLIDINTRGKRWVKFSDKRGISVLNINDFDNFIWEYLHYIDEGKFKKCIECGKLIRITNYKNKYCDSCRSIKNKEKYIKYNMKRK
ncbi:hypothetical protein [Lysinibacillus fusiformis]|uniref:hypothetical protein n=1 Tax=Lysinibacillus fusiformis TaxID=28031 RepID=UPI00263BE795|nr:hypothetical protein [Lysinibacillus fusiformis]MDC6267340.1 hypothetical protein [Lysinibacillus sphaericus]MDN4968226.1 hypothetical protein [Lysinibacillus fusiformis]MDN4968400.1 hypothetical protein [Lysinibacillus fusiformis]